MSQIRIEFNQIPLSELIDKIIYDINLIILELESLIGYIDSSYSISINFNTQNDNVTYTNEQSKSVKIFLPIYVLNPQNSNEEYQKKLNLSHELVHIITPMEDSSKNTYLEEGIAVWFSEKYTNTDSHPPAKYREARECAKKLFEINSNGIKNIREKYPIKKISEYSYEMIKSEFPGINDELISKLLEKFN